MGIYGRENFHTMLRELWPDHTADRSELAVNETAFQMCNSIGPHLLTLTMLNALSVVLLALILWRVW